MPRLFMALALARGDGRYAKLLRTLARIDLLILDDWGPEPLNAEQRRDLLEIVEDRYDVRSILITSQLPIERCYEVIGDPTLADAILDRIIHNAYRIELKGESMRKLKAVNTDPDARKPVKEAPQNQTASASTPAKVRRK
jgi:DNA replication protein DnaC